eukprot:scaffold307199_cov46-Prasinocladus_malaysianus.AAC.1
MQMQLHLYPEVCTPPSDIGKAGSAKLINTIALNAAPFVPGNHVTANSSASKVPVNVNINAAPFVPTAAPFVPKAVSNAPMHVAAAALADPKSAQAKALLSQVAGMSVNEPNATYAGQQQAYSKAPFRSPQGPPKVIGGGGREPGFDHAPHYPAGVGRGRGRELTQLIPAASVFCYGGRSGGRGRGGRGASPGQHGRGRAPLNSRF